MRTPFSKTIGNFDRVVIRSDGVTSEQLEIEQRLGYTDRTLTLVLRSDEAVHDLYYVLTRYLEHIKESK